MRAPVSKVMTRSVACVPEYLSVMALEELLPRCDLSAVPVMDSGGKLVGFVEVTDLVRELYHLADSAAAPADDLPGAGLHEESEPRTIAHVVTPFAFELPASCPVARAISLMGAQQVHQVPIVSDDGTLSGIVTASDIVGYLARAGFATSSADAGSAPRGVAERERLTEADRVASLGFLAGGVAHQVSNALTPLRLSLGRLTSFELSRRPLSAERMHRVELLQDIREGAAHIERIIRELKAFSHTDGPSRAVNVSELLEVAIGLAAHEIRHHARLVCDYATVPPVRAKPAELRQVFLNLLVNAAQAIPEGEAHVNEIRVMTRTDHQGSAVIEIKDTGIGIPPDLGTRIFEPFFTTRSAGRGLGLGLTVCRDIVAALDGEIVIDSVVGEGTTVRVVLPPCAEEALPAEAPDESRPDPAASSEPRRILIVDDDRPVAAALALELSAHDVVVAESGREALEILRHDKDFDVILCDLMMSNISGMDVYESLCLTDPAMLDRVVLMTGGAFTARAREFLCQVDTLVIEKPFHPGQLQEIVNAIEHRRHAADLPGPVAEEAPQGHGAAPLPKGL
jgi:signal transduction histidine kinase/CheY-like chemotaxis protein